MKSAHLLLVLALAVFSVHAQTLPAGQTLPAWSRFGAAISYKNIPYVANGTARQNFDLYLPASHDAKPLPLIFWIHGGGWTSGIKDWIEAPYLVRSGYALVSVDYRMSQDAIFPAQIQDCNTALNFIVAHAAEYDIDPKRIVVAGASAGGHLALLLGLARQEKAFNADPSIQPRAILNFYGPSDFTRIMDDLRAIHSDAGYNQVSSVVKRLLGIPVDTPSPQATTASPITYVDDKAPPTLSLAGKKDNLVPPEQSVRLHAVLDGLHVLNKLILIDGAGHAGSAFTAPAIQPQVIAFLDSLWKAKP